MISWTEPRRALKKMNTIHFCFFVLLKPVQFSGVVTVLRSPQRQIEEHVLTKWIAKVPLHPFPHSRTWRSRILILLLKFVAEYTDPLLFLFERTHNYPVDDLFVIDAASEGRTPQLGAIGQEQQWPWNTGSSHICICIYIYVYIYNQQNKTIWDTLLFTGQQTNKQPGQCAL